MAEAAKRFLDGHAGAHSGTGQFTVTTPAKIILCGEHSVVYGKLALAASVDLLTHINVIIQPASSISIHLDTLEFQWNVFPADLLPASGRKAGPQLVDHLKQMIDSQVADASIRASLLCICYLYCSLVTEPVGLTMRIRSAIPVGAGLGSSAALSVAVSAAFHVIQHLASSDQQFVADEVSVNRWAFHCEKLFHSTPSGIDNAVCTYGGIVKFQKEVVGSVAIPEARIILVNTQVSRQTKLLVEAVRRKRDRFPSVVDPVLDAMDQLSHQLAQVVLLPPETNYESIQELVTMNQCLLASLGVSHPSLDHIHNVAKVHGQAAKLTGAGGGGMAFIWLDPTCDEEKLQSLMEEMKRANYVCWSARLGVKGLRIEFS